MKQNTYKAQNIQVLKDLEAVRNKYNIFQLSEQIKKRGDNSKLAKILNIKESVLSRAICEAKILSISPDITIAKVTSIDSLKEHQIIKKYFEKVWDLNPTIGFRDKKYYYLRFKQEDTRKLISIIKPFIPNSMKYKIGERNE